MFEKEFKNEAVEIQGELVQVGESKLIKIPLDRLPTGTIIEVPVYVFNSENAGPRVLLQGGLHGDEVNSVEVLRRMLIDERYKIKRGCVIVIPLLNIFGFLSLSRDLHGKDVNRSFPGSKSGSLASRLANTLMKEIVKNVDFAIDFHTGGGQRNNYPQIRYSPEDSRATFLASVFKAPLQFASKRISKSFRNECAKFDIPVIVYEGGESLRLDEFSINEGIQGTLRILKHFDMIQNDVEVLKGHDTIFLENRTWIRAKAAGIFNASVDNGAFVKKGQVLGSIRDTYGETKITVKANKNGYIISKNYFPVINMGDALFHFGTEVE